MTTHQRLVEERPRLFHFTALGAWRTIAQHGLYCTSDLLAKSMQDTDEGRLELAAHRRKAYKTLSVPDLGEVVIRDQIPLNLKGLEKALPRGFAAQQWIDLLNQRVYFWTKWQDCSRLVDARVCRGSGSIVELDTASILEHYHTRVELTTFNVGYALRRPKLRSTASFIPLAEYPIGEFTKIRELTIRGSVQDLKQYALAVVEWTMDGVRTYQQLRTPVDGKEIWLRNSVPIS